MRSGPRRSGSCSSRVGTTRSTTLLRVRRRRPRSSPRLATSTRRCPSTPRRRRPTARPGRSGDLRSLRDVPHAVAPHRLRPAPCRPPISSAEAGRSFKSNGITCYRVAVAPNDAASRPPLLSAIQAWATGRVRTSVDANGDFVGFTACDPGSTAAQPSTPRFHELVAVLSFRADITVGAAQGHQSGDFARCVARVLPRPSRSRTAGAGGSATSRPPQVASASQVGTQSGTPPAGTIPTPACRNQHSDFGGRSLPRAHGLRDGRRSAIWRVSIRTI